MKLRLVVLAVVLLILGAIGYFAGTAQAVVCGIAAVVVYAVAFYRRFNAAEAPGRRLGHDNRDSG